MLNREQKAVHALFAELRRSPLQEFPRARKPLKAPNKQGVYIIYDPRNRAVHVGATPSGAGGIRKRLANHLHNASAFSVLFLKGGAKLRCGYKYRCLIVPNRRRRALVKAYAIGYLCPTHPW
jgi:hypothetical protein